MTCELYRHYNAEGVLLYVGISFGALIRNRWHQKHSSWFESVAHITIERYPTQEIAKEAEAAAIIEERPIYNKQHNWRPPVIVNGFVSMADIDITDDSMEFKAENADIVKKLLGVLTEKERRVIVLRYGLDGESGFTMGEIAWMLNITRQYVQMLIVSAEIKMRRAAAFRYQLIELPAEPPPTPKPPPAPIDLVELGLI